MKRKSILYKDLEVSRAKEIYDESCKNILANKIILAWIMKSCMKEYKDCSIRDIADHYIEGIPEISQREVHRDEAPASDPGKIRGENTEDKAVNEGTVRFHPNTARYLSTAIMRRSRKYTASGSALTRRRNGRTVLIYIP